MASHQETMRTPAPRIRKMGPARVLTLGTTSLALIALMFSSMGSSTARAASPVGLGTATSFAILAGTAITDVPTSSIIGDVGLSPTTGAAIGLTCAEVTGTIYAVDAFGPAPCSVENPGLLTTAKNDLGTAYDDADGRVCPPSHNLTGTDLGGLTLTDGVYCFSSTAGLTGTLTLNAEGNPDAVFIFQIGSSLTTATSSVVDLINGAQACNVFWQVTSSAALGTSSTFVGTIMALTSITVGNAVTVEGRLLARNGNVTLIADTITRSDCAPVTTTTTTTGTGTATTTTTTTGTGTATTTTTTTGTGTATTGTGTGTGTTTTTSTGTGAGTGTTTTTSTETGIVTPTPFQGAMDELPGSGPSASTFASLGIAALSVGLILFAIGPWKGRRGSRAIDR